MDDFAQDEAGNPVAPPELQLALLINSLPPMSIGDGTEDNGDEPGVFFVL